MSEHEHDPVNCPRYVLTARSGGIIELDVCWNQANVRQIAQELRELATGLDTLPEGTEGPGVVPL